VVLDAQGSIGCGGSSGTLMVKTQIGKLTVIKDSNDINKGGHSP